MAVHPDHRSSGFVLGLENRSSANQFATEIRQLLALASFPIVSIRTSSKSFKRFSRFCLMGIAAVVSSVSTPFRSSLIKRGATPGGERRNVSRIFRPESWSPRKRNVCRMGPMGLEKMSVTENSSKRRSNSAHRSFYRVSHMVDTRPTCGCKDSPLTPSSIRMFSNVDPPVLLSLMLKKNRMPVIAIEGLPCKKSTMR